MERGQTYGDIRPMSEFRDEGLLWLVNASVFHPRGYALAFHLDDDGVVVGWTLEGDGSEPWVFEANPVVDALMRSAKQLLS
ncbi:MAG: hypothetical protein AB7O86_05655 [Porticoccaceae bacterium]